MNEYRVMLADGAGQRELTVQAATAAAARELAEGAHDAEVIAVRFVRAVTFGCATRGGRPSR